MDRLGPRSLILRTGFCSGGFTVVVSVIHVMIAQFVILLMLQEQPHSKSCDSLLNLVPYGGYIRRGLVV